MIIEQVDHIHIAVKDLDKAVKTFEKLFDLKFSKELVLPQYGVKSRLASMGSIGIELMQAISSDTGFAKFVEHRGEGVHAISLKVPDIDKAVAEAEAKGVRCVDRVEVPLVREAELHPKDLFGMQIEFVQYEMYPTAAYAAFGESIK